VTPAHTRRHGAFVAIVVGVIVPCALMGVTVAAGAGTTPPPTPVPPNGSLSPFPSVLHTPADTASRPVISAASAVLADLDTGQVLFSKAQGAPRAIASLTKMMTAIVVVERTKPTDVVAVAPGAVFGPRDFGASSTLALRAGERLSVRDLLYGMLLASANDAAVALAEHVSGSVDAFVGLMNRRATALGMRATLFDSPNGLDDRGRSTASDVVRLVRTMYRIPLLSRIAVTRHHDVTSSAHGVRRIQNRNALLWLYPGAIGAKTGTTAAAGDCLAAVAERGGRRLVAVVLGSPHEPFSEAAALLNYGFDAFERRDLVTRGEPAGTIAINGGSVPVVAGGDVTAFVSRTASIRLLLESDRSVAFPPVPGDVVGVLRVSAGTKELGTVPLLAVAAALPPAPAGSWWLRAGASVGSALARAVSALG
jgi:D-alanyl-D-alanine carboxypeptidase (penicillin-binding protein 5/6)